MFYSYFESLCEQKGVSPNQACKEMGVSRSVAAKWKSTNTSPRMDTLIKISNYFGVSIDELLAYSENGNKKTATNDGDGYQTADETKKHLSEREELKRLIDRLTDEEVSAVLARVKNLILGV